MSGKTPTFDITSPQKFKNFQTKFVRDLTPDTNNTPVPPPRNSIFDDLNITRNLSASTGPITTIHVTPDSRYVLLTITYHVMKIYPTLELKNDPHLTPSSIIAYCLLHYYAFLFASDYYGSPTASHYANKFMETNSHSEFVSTILETNTPPFMLDIFTALAPTLDPRRPDIHYAATLAASQFEYDFGRLIPPQVFIIAHNLAATNPANTVPNTVLTQLFASPLFATQAGFNDLSVGNYFSAGIPIANEHIYLSYLTQRLIDIVSPVTNRSLQNRPFLSRFPHSTPTINTPRTNPYVTFLNCHPENIYNTMNFLTKLSPLMKRDLNASSNLGQIMSNLSGINITTHGTSTFSIPTWHHHKVETTNCDMTSISSDAAYAKNIRFLQSTPFIATGSPAPPTADITPQLYLVKAGKYKDIKDPDSPILYKKELHETAPVRFLSPYVDSPSAIGYPAISGLIIEAFEIDGSSVPALNLSNSLHADNAQYKQGSLPLSRTYKALSSGNTSPLSALPTVPNDEYQQKVNIDLYDTASNRLANFTQETDDAIPAALPGFNITPGVRSFSRAFSKISYKTGTHPVNKKVPVWSPYRFIEGNTNIEPTPDTVYVLTNLRTLYGTHIPVVEVQSPARRLSSI